MSDVFSDYLDEEDREMWTRCNSQYDLGLRQEAHSTLAELVERVRAYPEETLHEMVYDICRAHFDESNPQTIRRLQFSEIILPEMRRGYERKAAPYARWLAQSRDQFGSWHNTASSGDEDGMWKGDLLDEAISVDPGDVVARELYIDLLDLNFRYYIHEVPSGLLVEPSEFRRLLDRFAEVVEAHGVAADYADALRICRFYCESYDDFLSHRRDFTSYADYLSRTEPRYESKYPRHWRRAP